MTGELIATSEIEVLYLFSKYHELLGFEKTLAVQSKFPDVVAVKNDKKVKIELEYNLGSLKAHMIILEVGSRSSNRGRIIEKDNKIYYKEDYSNPLELLCDNKNSEYKVQNKGRTTRVMVNNLKTILDYVVCWKKNTAWDPGIPIIELSEALPRLGITTEAVGLPAAAAARDDAEQHETQEGDR